MKRGGAIVVGIAAFSFSGAAHADGQVFVTVDTTIAFTRETPISFGATAVVDFAPNAYPFAPTAGVYASAEWTGLEEASFGAGARVGIAMPSWATVHYTPIVAVGNDLGVVFRTKSPAALQLGGFGTMTTSHYDAHDRHAFVSVRYHQLAQLPGRFRRGWNRDWSLTTGLGTTLVPEPEEDDYGYGWGDTYDYYYY